MTPASLRGWLPARQNCPNDVLAAGDPRPEQFALTGTGREKTVILDRTAENDIDRLELLDSTGSPIRLGPRLPWLPSGDGYAPGATRS